MNNQNWDDLRFVLAVAEHGSLNAAATRLRVTHATVMRRVAAFEDRYGRAIFEKSQSGYRPLPQAAPILRALTAVSDAVLATERTIVGADPSPSGPVRIASTDSLCQRVLPQIIRNITRTHPRIDLTLLSANVHHDLSRMSADIVVRPTHALGDDLTGHQSGDLTFGLYTNGTSDQRWLALEGALGGSLAAKWMDENVVPDQIIGGADSFLVLQHMAAQGIGKALLPRIVGDPDPRLHTAPDPAPAIAVPVWVACLKEFGRTPRFALVQKMLARELTTALAPTVP